MAATAERLGGRYVPSDSASYADGGGAVVSAGPASPGGNTYVFPATIHNSDPRFAVRQVSDEFRREFGSE